MSITIEIADLTGAECGWIAVTAAEGGIGYWSQIKSYQYTRWFPDDSDSGGLGDPAEVADDFVFYTIAPLNDDETGYDTSKAIDVTPALLRRGFEIGYKADRDKGGWLIQKLVANTTREDWPGEIDAQGADMIVQWGAFGELVYG